MSQSQPFNPELYKRTTEQQWQEMARAWYDWTATLAEWLEPATNTMLDLARIGSGSRVIDIAAGTGEQSVRAAQRVGKNGYVLATDISSNILNFVGELAATAELDNIQTAVMDGENLQVESGSFDAAISRLGLIYFPDKLKSLASILRALRPGGWFATVVFSTPEKNRFFSEPVAIVRSATGTAPPLPGQPGPFSLGSEGTLQALLEQGGFVDVEIQEIASPLRMPSARDCVRFEKDSFGALHQMMSELSQRQKTAVWDEVEARLEQFETSAGFEGPCELIVGAGMKPIA